MNIKQTVNERGMTLKQLARSAGVDYRRLSKFTTGEIILNELDSKAVANALLLELHEIFTDELTVFFEEVVRGQKRACGGAREPGNKTTYKFTVELPCAIATAIEEQCRAMKMSRRADWVLGALEQYDRRLRRRKKKAAPVAGTTETAGVSRSPQSNDSPSIGQGGQNVNDSSFISKPI